MRSPSKGYSCFLGALDGAAYHIKKYPPQCRYNPQSLFRFRKRTRYSQLRIDTFQFAQRHITSPGNKEGGNVEDQPS